MKRIICLLLALVMCFSLVACGNTGNDAGNTDHQDVVTPDIGDKGNGTGTGDSEAGTEDVGTDTGDSEVGTEGSEDMPDEGESDSIAQLIVAKIAEANPETFAANMPLDADMIATYYAGLTDIETVDVAIYMPMMSAVVCEIAIVEVTNSEDIEAVKTIFQNRIAYQVGDDENPGGAWYPESIEGWKNHSTIVVEGDFVMLIAWEGKDSAISIFRELTAA